MGMKALFAFLLLFLSFRTGGANHFNGSNFIGRHNEMLYLIHRGRIRKLPAESTETTIRNLGFDPNLVHNISAHHVRSLVKGDDVPVVKLERENDVDEVIRVFLLANKVLQGRLIESVTHIGNYINPSLVPFRGRLLMATGLAWTVNGVNEGKPATEFLEFRWFNNSAFPFHSSNTYLGIDTYIHPLNDTGLLGQDPRMVKVNEDKVVIVYTNRFEPPKPRMGLAELVYNKTTNRIQAGRVFLTLFFNSRNTEKNWSPFVVDNKDVYLIQSINPMVVVGYVAASDNKASAIVASQAPYGHHPFRFGHLRGGTNAVDLGDKYLAFFHSTTVLQGNYLTTYMMGAYTFTKHNPWRLLSMSPEPILDDWMYQGEWAPFKNRHMDYVVFPNSLLLLNATGEVIVTFGHQDYKGFAATIKLKRLLDSLSPVVYCDEDKHPELKALYCKEQEVHRSHGRHYQRHQR